MPGPSDFVNFSDYLGLNQEAGAGMRAAADAGYNGPRADDIRGFSQQHYIDAAAAGNGDVGAQAQYQRSGEAVRTGTASYGEFLSGMADPAKRQALMEKVYGKGHVSALDSALGGSSSPTGANSALSSLQHETEQQGIHADQRKQMYSDNKAAQDASDAAGAKARQARYDAAQKAAAEKARAIELTRWDMAQKGQSGREEGRDVTAGYAARGAAGMGGTFRSARGSADPQGQYQAWLAKRRQNPDYGAYNTELQSRKDAQDKQNSRPFSFVDPSSW